MNALYAQMGFILMHRIKPIVVLALKTLFVVMDLILGLRQDFGSSLCIVIKLLSVSMQMPVQLVVSSNVLKGMEVIYVTLVRPIMVLITTEMLLSHVGNVRIKA